MLFYLETDVPKCYWSNGVLTVAFLINRMPFLVFAGKSIIYTIVAFPNAPLFQVPFKYLVVPISKQQRDTLDVKTTKCIFMEYPSIKAGIAVKYY